MEIILICFDCHYETGLNYFCVTKQTKCYECLF